MFQFQSYQHTSTYCKWLEMPFTNNQRRTGRVKFFNAKKGYGFITPFRTLGRRGSKVPEGKMRMISFFF